MSADRELLELAAKAAGLQSKWDQPRGADFGRLRVFDGADRWPTWNPLADDGDALRLAVALRLSVHIDQSLTDVDGATTEAHLGDPFAATRRAIVRAAAEIGRTMP